MSTDRIASLADDAAKRLAALLSAAFLARRARVDQRELADAVRRLGTREVVELLALDESDLATVAAALDEVYVDAATLAGEDVPGEANLSDPAFVAAREALVAATIRAIVADSNKAVRNAADRLTANDRNASATSARLVSIIGLTPAQAHAFTTMHRVLDEARRVGPTVTATLRVGNDVTRYGPDRLPYFSPSIRELSGPQQALVRSLISKSTSPERAQAALDRFARKMVEVRAQAIAVTEATRITNAGEHEVQRQALRDGRLPPDTRRFWVDRGDGRVRPEHAAVKRMNQLGVRIDQPFITPRGPTMYPPLEIRCRCRVALRIPPKN